MIFFGAVSFLLGFASGVIFLGELLHQFIKTEHAREWLTERLRWLNDRQ